jgi:2-polyprenyl-3-methyl-5-hydroxy-6-metoxy-1,4-benzoquinol methylase
MTRDRGAWESRHEEGPGATTRPPSAFLAAHLGSLPRGSALDVACGEGRHALYLARHGWRVDAIDFARSALVRLQATARREQLTVHAVQADLEQYPLPHRRYDVVVNVRYLQRSLFDPLKAALRRGGMIVFETFLRDQQKIGHPKNPAYLLERGELRTRFADFQILSYEEGQWDEEGGPAFLARMLARRP